MNVVEKMDERDNFAVVTAVAVLYLLGNLMLVVNEDLCLKNYLWDHDHQSLFELYLVVAIA